MVFGRFGYITYTGYQIPGHDSIYGADPVNWADSIIPLAPLRHEEPASIPDSMVLSDPLSGGLPGPVADPEGFTDSIPRPELPGEVPGTPGLDSLNIIDSIVAPPAVRDSAPRKPLLDDIITGHNKDSLVYDVTNRLVYIYTDGDITYQDMNLKADYMQINMESKDIYAYGYSDTLGNRTRPEFLQGGGLYTMDTITYNLDSQKAKIKGVFTQEGDGYLIAEEVKKMPDNTTNIAHGRYTTCDHLDHPHFYLAMSRAKVIPGKKVIVGPSHFVMEDVPIRFPLLPFGFFPITSGRSSGFIVPTFGEEYVKGFFIRDGGYYFAISDYIDLTLLGGIYTLGSWDARANSRYIKRYRFNGTLNAHYSKDIRGEKGLADYVNGSNFMIKWTHTQDPKFRPNSTFSASVDYSSGGYSKNSATTLQDNLNSQTNSSISYSKTWPGRPFSLSTSLNASQNTRDSTVKLTFPNLTFNVSKIYPFKRREALGRARWYEKISFSYTGSLQNTVTSKEYDLFTPQMWKDMRNGVNHSIPVSASWTLFNYINVTPSFNYTERWYFQRINQEYDPSIGRPAVVDTTYGFYRVYNYSVSGSLSTKIYGLFQMKGENAWLKAVRHVITPTVSFSYSPDFSNPKYGFYRPIQADSLGRVTTYSPYQNTVYGIPGSGRSASINFSLGNNLEAKIRSDRDTTGMRKISLIDQLTISSSYNFLADSLKLAPFSLTFKTTIYGNYAINLTATLNPYQTNADGQDINRFLIRQGRLVRLTRLSTSFGYTFNSTTLGRSVMNDPNSWTGEEHAYNNGFFDESTINNIDPNQRRMMMTAQYYDFNIPWNLSFNYNFSYSTSPSRNGTGETKNIVQTLGVSGSVTLTEKWGITFSSFSYDFQRRQITPGTVNITRDLHCWQMNLSWIPIGTMKQWSFNISVKSPVLRDLKYDKSSSRYDTLYD